MGKVVNPIATRVRCEMHPCKERAAFALCEGGRRQVAFNVCEKHLRQIVEEGLVALDMLEDIELDENGDPIILGSQDKEPEHEEPIIPTSETENAAESDENMSEEATTPEPREIAGEQKTEVENAEETEPEQSDTDPLVTEPEEKPVTAEVYTCKHCSATFPKTKEGKIALMTHSRNCPNKPPKE